MSNRDFIFWGASGHAKVLADLIKLEGSRLIALFDNNPDCVSPWSEIPLYYGTKGFSSWLVENEGLELPQAAIAIGGHRGKDRCQIYNRLVSAGLALPPLVHPHASIAPSANIDQGCHILAGSVIGSDVKLKRCVIVNTSASVDHECHLKEGVHIAPGVTLCGCVVVDSYSLVGPGSVVLPHIKIGSNSIIGAGSVVTRDIPDNVIVWGSPAKVVKGNNK